MAARWWCRRSRCTRHASARAPTRSCDLARGQPDRWFDPMPHKSIGMREDYGPVWSPDGAQMAAIVDGLLTRMAGGARRHAARLAAADLDRARRFADVDRRLTPRPLSERRPAPAGRRRVGPGCADDRAAPHVDARRAARRLEDDPRRPVLERPRRFSAGQHRHRRRRRPDQERRAAQRRAPRRHGRRCVEGHRHPRPRRDPHPPEQGFRRSARARVSRMGHHHGPQPGDQRLRTREYREAFESGARIGPRLFTTGEPFDGSRIYYPGGMSLDDTGQLPLALQHARRRDSTSSRPTSGCRT